MDGHGGNQPYPPPHCASYASPYGGYPPPNNPNQPPPPPPSLSPSASFPSHPYPYPHSGTHLQFNHSGPLQYPPPPAYYNSQPYPSPPPVYYDPNLYPHPQQPPSSFHHYPQPDHHLTHSPSTHTHLSYPPPPPSRSDSISSVHEGISHMHISDTQPECPPPVSTSLPHHQRYDSFGSSYSNSPVSAPPASPFSGGSQSQHGSSSQIVPYTGSPSGKGKSSLKVLLLHGSLEIFIRYAKNLPNKDMFHKTIGDLLGPRVTNSISGGIQKVGGPMTSDPYVTVSVSYAVIARTYVIDNNENPVWDQHFYVPVAHEAAEVLFTVKDNDVFGAQHIGTVSIPTETIYSGERIDGIFPVLGPNGKPCNQGAVLSLLIQYIPVARLTMYHHGVTVGPDCRGVPNTYFSLRRGGKVTLYQDAHVPDNCLPNFWLENGMQYKHGQCWRDVFDAISGATRLIYIVGWSVFHTVTLVRDGGRGNMVMLGDLLKRKSQEGARVCLLIWDDPTSRSILGIKTVSSPFCLNSILAIYPFFVLSRQLYES